MNDRISISDRKFELDKKFSVWIHSQGLSKNDFNDTLADKAFELCAYYDYLKKEDSLSTWSSSIDSAYYLLTKFDTINGRRRIHDGYRFLDSKSKKVYIGIGPSLNEDYLPVTQYWYDTKTIYILEKDVRKNHFNMVRLVMGVDSIWTFNTK